MADDPAKKTPLKPLGGLNPLGLLDGVLAGQSGDWEPPRAAELELLFPGYKDFEFIDRGGMGAVYSATQNSLERRVAVKILPPEVGHDIAFVDRFHQEARLLARLQHPHIVTIYDFGRNASGHLFIVMEYVEGTSLQDVMKVGRLTLTKVLEVTLQVCEALQFAHDHGVVHRDIKPTNILLDVWGRVRVADFGLAKLALPSHKTTVRTSTSMLMGTPGYASPEQRRGEPKVDHRADIFSLGVTLYEMLTEHLPVGVFEPPSKKSDAPALMDKVVLKAMRERPGDRYQKASDMRDAIATVAEKLGRPLVQRAIAKRPIISMMTSVIVGAGFIYLLDALNTELLEKPRQAQSSYVDSEHGPTVMRLTKHFSLVRLRLNWEEARRRIKATQGVEMASFHSQAELDEVVAKLHEREVDSPVWTGGFQVEGDPANPYRWDDGSPFYFQAWMPAAPASPLLITEVQAKNHSTLKDAQGNTPDWIEVHNPGAEPVDISGWHLRHISGRYAFEGRLGGRRSRFPGEQLLIRPGEYKVVYCIESEPVSSNALSYGFQLEAQLGRVRWCDPRGNIIQAMDEDWVRFPADGSLVSGPDGKGWGWAAVPTPGEANRPFEQAAPFQGSLANTPNSNPQAILLLPDFGGRWALDTQRRTAWTLVRVTPAPEKEKPTP